MSHSQNKPIPALVPISYVAIVAFIAVSTVVVCFNSIRIHDITKSWKAQPFVSVYVPHTYDGGMCAKGYERLNLDYNMLNGVSPGPCGCAQNGFPYHSSNDSCSAEAEVTPACASLSPLPELWTNRWRESSICVKRGGKPAAIYRKDGYHGRPHPDKDGHCPKGFKKCGRGSSHQQGAICFPENAECPITNMKVVPQSQQLSASDGWEAVGTFPHNDLVLYVGRERIGELPIVEITAALTSQSSDGRPERGPCYHGADQKVETVLQTDPTELWSYGAAVPPVCKVVDPRWHLADSMSLEYFFLAVAETTVPTCDSYKLYSLSDPRYNASADPDYLHSGVPCGTAPLYSACARDPFQHTDCAAGDSICDGVVHQNICGEYARAVRSAFADSTTSMGLYFVREIEWADSCAVSKASIFRYRTWIPNAGQLLGFGAIMLLAYFASLFCILLGFFYVYKLHVVYQAVSTYQCTDEFTSSLILGRLHLVPLSFDLALAVALVAPAAMMVVGIFIYWSEAADSAYIRNQSIELVNGARARHTPVTQATQQHGDGAQTTTPEPAVTVDPTCDTPLLGHSGSGEGGKVHSTYTV